MVGFFIYLFWPGAASFTVKEKLCRQEFDQGGITGEILVAGIEVLRMFSGQLVK